MTRFRVGWLVAMLALGGCVPRPKPALRIAGHQFRAQVQGICLFATTAEIPLPDAATRLQPVDYRLASVLTTAGYRVVGAAQVAPLVRWVIESEQGYYDRHTGRRDAAKYRFVRRRVMHELKRQLDCDVALYPHIAVVSATWSNGIASWDGTTDHLGSGWGANGSVGALSLWVRLVDLEDEEIYFGTGGVQIVSRLETGFLTSSFTPIDQDQLLSEPWRLVTAVDASLQTILDPGFRAEVP